MVEHKISKMKMFPDEVGMGKRRGMWGGVGVQHH